MTQQERESKRQAVKTKEIGIAGKFGVIIEGFCLCSQRVGGRMMVCNLVRLVNDEWTCVASGSARNYDIAMDRAMKSLES